LLAQEIGRSCSLMQGYIIFMDGSAYVYSAPSQEEFEQLCDNLHRGAQFNFQVRRAVFGFTRGFTPPADYEVIYEYPPYEGTAPGVCDICSGHVTNIEDCAYTLGIVDGTGSVSNAGNVVTFGWDDHGSGGAFGNFQSVDFCMRTSYEIFVTASMSGVGANINAAVFINATQCLPLSGFGDGTSQSSSGTPPAGNGYISCNFFAAIGSGILTVTLTPATAP
jgi:hypothetical protein